MLLVTLFVAVVLLVVINMEMRRPTPLTSSAISIAAAFGSFSLVLCFSLVNVAQAVIVGGLFALWRWRRWSPKLFLPASICGVLLTYWPGYRMYLREKTTFDSLREEFRYESMADRLPSDRPNTAGKFDDVVLTALEDRFESQFQFGSQRTQMLQRLHEQQINEFIDQPGFGFSRMADMRPRRESIIEFPPRTPIPQRGPARLFVPTMNEPQPMLPLTLRDAESNEPHLDSILDFVNARGFGYFKDREHVAGFQPHQFSKLPKFNERWDVERVELVGLLMHKQPVVYVSEYLPRMDELRQAPTRPLDAFETTALADVRQGHELRFADTPTGARMLGAIRSVSQCNKCHDTERGALLGAFSYTLKTRAK